MAVFGVLAIALLAPSAGFSNNAFNPYSPPSPTTVVTTESGTVYTITSVSTTSFTQTATFSYDGSTYPLMASITGNISSSQITGFTGVPTSSPSTPAQISFTMTGQTASHVTLTVCVPAGYAIAASITVNGESVPVTSSTFQNGIACFTFTTHFSTDNVVLTFSPLVTVTTDKSSYPPVAGTMITVSGVITPAIGVPGTSATVMISNGNGLLLTQSTPVDSATGAYSTTFVSLSNSSSLWVSGVYNATTKWAAAAPPSPVYSGTASFGYGATLTTATSTTTTTSSSGTGSTITSSTTVTSTVNTSTQTTTTIGGTSVTVTTSVPGTTSTTTKTGSMNTTVIAIGAAAVVVAIIAGALAAMALRKK